MALGKYSEARSFIRSLPPVSHHLFWKQNAGPEMGWRRLLVAESEIAEGDYQSAADELEKPIPELFVKNSIHAELQVALAKAYLGLGKNPKAASVLEQALRSGCIDHEFFELYSELIQVPVRHMLQAQNLTRKLLEYHCRYANLGDPTTASSLHFISLILRQKSYPECADTIDRVARQIRQE